MICCYNSLEDNDRYWCIDRKLRQCFDDMVKVEEEIESLKIELEIAKRLGQGSRAIRRNILLAKVRLKELEEREEILDDLLDKELINSFVLADEKILRQAEPDLDRIRKMWGYKIVRKT